MSRNYHHHLHHHVSRPQVVVNDNDVLSGRGVNIAHHPGNERFRTLVSARADASYCTSYSASEKRAVAEEIIQHIQSLDPPGRFLKREGRGQVSRGLNGPWEILSDREAIKKTCQALRDCNRQDRTGYAIGVVAPQDVVKDVEQRTKTGLSWKQQAAQAAAANAAAAAVAASATLKRNREHFNAAHIPVGVAAMPHVYPPPMMHGHTPAPAVAAREDGDVSPSLENSSEWSKKLRMDDGIAVSAAVSASPADSSTAVLPDGGGLLAPHPLSDANGYGHHHAHVNVAHHHQIDPVAMAAAAHQVVHHHDPFMVNGGAHHHHHPLPIHLEDPTQNHHHHLHHLVSIPAPAPMHFHSPITDPNLAHLEHEDDAAPGPVNAPRATDHVSEDITVGSLDHEHDHDAVVDADPLILVKEEDTTSLNIAEL